MEQGLYFKCKWRIKDSRCRNSVLLSLLSLPSAQILQPENFHGSFELKFDLIGSFNDFSSRSTSEVANINVTVAEIAENQAFD